MAAWQGAEEEDLEDLPCCPVCLHHFGSGWVPLSLKSYCNVLSEHRHRLMHQNQFLLYLTLHQLL